MKSILFLGFLLRLLFLGWGSGLYYGPNPYVNNDSFSYTEAFLNWYQTGSFTFDLQNADAFFGRLPGFPFFWGMHYVLFGPDRVYPAVAFSHVLLDVLAIFLISRITERISGNARTGLIASLLYALCPFIIVWLTITGTEALATFATVLFFYVLLCHDQSPLHPFFVAILAAAAFYVRVYLGILVLPTVLYYFLRESWAVFLKKSLAFCLLFFFFYSFWPLRNFLFYDRLVWLKPPTSGYDRYGMDIIAIRDWVYCWTPDADPFLDRMAKTEEPVLDRNLFTNNADFQLAETLIKKARKGGTGTYCWKTGQRYPYPANHNDEITVGFTYLKGKFRADFPLTYYFRVPFLNLKKAIFKDRLTDQPGSLVGSLIRLLFWSRTIIIFLGFGGLFLGLRRGAPAASPASFVVFQYLFICFLIRQLEMRYLVQADALLIPFAAISLHSMLFPTQAGNTILVPQKAEAGN